jgi:uncharacterized ubiquitin-like protein YukD
MNEITIKLLTTDGSEHKIETPSDITAKDLIVEVTIALDLPLTDAGGNSISWRLDDKSSGKTLLADKTLAENQVVEGQTLILVRSNLVKAPMNEITIKLLTMDGSEHEIETPTDIKAKDFIVEVTIALALPLTDAAGASINWRLHNKNSGKTLVGDKTLAENEVVDGQALILVRATVAG